MCWKSVTWMEKSFNNGTPNYEWQKICCLSSQCEQKLFPHKCITTQTSVKNKAHRRYNRAIFQIFLCHVVSVGTIFFSPTLPVHWTVFNFMRIKNSWQKGQWQSSTTPCLETAEKTGWEVLHCSYCYQYFIKHNLPVTPVSGFRNEGVLWQLLTSSSLMPTFLTLFFS